jgi:hypothetical protein
VRKRASRPGPVVPGDGSSGGAEVPPAVGDAELAEVDMAGHLAAGQQGVGWAVVAVAHHEVFVAGSQPLQLAPGTGGVSGGGSFSGGSRLPREGASEVLYD